MKKILLSFLLVAIVSFTFAQQWGMYTLYSGLGGSSTYLIDTAGTTYKTWSHSSSYVTGYSCYMISDTLLRSYQLSSTDIDHASGATGGIQKVTWDGDIAWDWTYSSSTKLLHHDICALPNGNVLMICYDKRTSTEMTQAGSNDAQEVLSETIIEVKPTGSTTGEIVWQWVAWDHLSQDYNSSKDNYVSSIVNNPQLLNINYGMDSGAKSTKGPPPSGTTEWLHMNGIDYNVELDQIAFSSHTLNEIYILDHSTTTAQAATHTGGNAGMGGDILFRWGNPEAYEASGTANFDVVHDAHWVSADHPDYAGCLVGFNNYGGSSGYAAIDVFTSPLNGYNYDIILGQAFEPDTYTHRYNSSYSSFGQSSSEQFPNGNMLLCAVTQGATYMFEIDSDGTSLWSKTVSGTVPQAHRYEKCYIRGIDAKLLASETEITQGESVTLNTTATANTESSPTFSYNWSSSPAGFTSTAANPSVTPDETTTYYVTVTNDQSGCSDELFVEIDVESVIVATNFTADIIEACGNLTVNFTDASTGNPTSWLWNFGDGNTSSQQNPSYTYNTPGTYTVSLVATNVNGSDTYSVEDLISVYVNPSVNLGEDLEQCGGSVSLDAGAGFESYAWDGNLGNQTLTVYSSDTYTVEVEDINGCTATDVIDVSIYAIPTVYLGDDIEQCGGNVSLDAGSGFVSYTWNGVAGNQTNTVSTNNTYVVAVEDANGCTTSDQIVVTIYDVPVVNLGDDFSICSGSTSTLDAGTGYVSYTWNGTLGTSTYAVSEGDNYEVVITDYNGCTANDEVVVTVFLSPTISLTMTQETTAGASDGSVTVTPESGLSPFSYSWNSGEETSIVTALSAGQYCVTVNDGNACSVSDCISVTIADQINPPVADFTADVMQGCDMITVQFTDQSTNNPTEWTWDFGDGGSSIEENPEYTYNSVGTYTVSLTVSNDDGTSAPKIETDYIVLGETPQLSMSMTPESEAEEADGTAMVTATGGTGSYEYLWNNGSTTLGISDLIGGTYCVTVTDANTCIASDCITVSVLESDFALFTADVTDGCAPQEVNFTDQSTGDIISWTWNFGDGSSSVEQNPTHNYQTSGIYTVSLTVIYTDGSDTHVEVNYIEVYEVPELSFDVTNESGAGASDGVITLNISGGESPYAITWSNNAHTETVVDLSADIYSVVVIDDNGCMAMGNATVESYTNIANSIINDIRIYPNPTDDEINIISPTEIKAIYIYDITGKLIIQKNILNNYCKINLQELQSGIYVIDVQTNKESLISRIVKN
jgi:PKD repeat protein